MCVLGKRLNHAHFKSNKSVPARQVRWEGGAWGDQGLGGSGERPPWKGRGLQTGPWGRSWRTQTAGNHSRAVETEPPPPPFPGVDLHGQRRGGLRFPPFLSLTRTRPRDLGPPRARGAGAGGGGVLHLPGRAPPGTACWRSRGKPDPFPFVRGKITVGVCGVHGIDPAKDQHLPFIFFPK